MEDDVCVFEIIVPGTWLDCQDRDWSWRMEGLLQHLRSQFFEANTALNLFTGSQSARVGEMDRESWERDRARRSEILREIEASMGVAPWHLSRDRRERINLEAEIHFKREQWEHGRAPAELQHSVPFVY